MNEHAHEIPVRKPFQIAFASCSIGCKPEHTLPEKIKAISATGFNGIELSMPDLLAFASSRYGRNIDSYDFENLSTAAAKVKSMCDANGLQIMLLQPFANFEGWQQGSSERNDAFKRARGWVQIMKAGGIRTLQVGSSDSPQSIIGNDRSRFVSDLCTLADMLAEDGLEIAYENWCWSTHAPTWSDVWSIVKRVNRPNFKLCLDTFQTAGAEWADPSTKSGLIEPEGKDHATVQKEFDDSLRELSREIPPDRIYMLQISDAYKPKTPIAQCGPDGQRPRSLWSHDYRPAPFQEGYLPVAAVTRAVLQTGFTGWLSYEIFDGGPDGKGLEYDLIDFAERVVHSHEKLIEACGL